MMSKPADSTGSPIVELVRRIATALGRQGRTADADSHDHQLARLPNIRSVTSSRSSTSKARATVRLNSQGNSRRTRKGAALCLLSPDFAHVTGTALLRPPPTQWPPFVRDLYVFEVDPIL